jgi:acyl-coenzyme A thioesterase PaaI-like protein
MKRVSVCDSVDPSRTQPERGQLGASDAALLAFARAEGRVLITADPDHLRLHAAGVPHAGVLFAPPDAAIGLLIGGAMMISEVLRRRGAHAPLGTSPVDPANQ